MAAVQYNVRQINDLNFITQYCKQLIVMHTATLCARPYPH